ncbi:unnamed protein product [Brachionus calyciflorus]|uniref:Uncharacterized protein n=1 Tax=Brachionus calyciflorus TaxID=104777 RepID=A0A813Z0R2_9BILA|nr:unnamed protein product [Brachionus calyciflorus]
MLDFTDIPSDSNEQLNLHFPKLQDTETTIQTNEEIETRPEKVDPGPAELNEPESSSTLVENKNESNYDQYDEFKIRVGDDYQIDLSNYIPSKNKRFRKNIIEKETPIWRPNNEQIDESKIDTYLKELSKLNYFNIENALSILYTENYNTEKAISSLKNSGFSQIEWTKEDKVLFEQGMWYYGKNFHRINQLLPHKTHSNLVSYYYKWKKTRNKKQLSIVNIDATCSTSTNSSENFGENNDSNTYCDL